MKKALLILFIPMLFGNCENPTPPSETTEAIKTIDSTKTAPTTTSQPEMPLKEESAIKKTDYQFPYDLNKPVESFKLSGKLVEISGLSLSSDGEFILAHNDEQGKIFYLKKKNGKIEDDFKFYKNGDYEGIEMVGDKIYVTRNNGTIYEVSDLESDKPKTKDFKTDLSAANDVEGLGFDSKNNRLLLACKGKAGDGKEYKRTRAIYGCDLNTKKLIERPVYLINRNAIQSFIQTNSDRLEKFLEALIPEQAASAFAPSGIAIHPKTGNIYILSSVGKLLVVLNPNGQIIHIQELDKSIHKQPEGIAFEQDGTLWISSEGKGSSGKLFKFVIR